MSRAKDPRSEKEKDYSRQSRASTGESRHAERKNRRKRRARTHRAERRAVRQVLGKGSGTLDENHAERLEDGVAGVRLPYFVIWSPVRLGQFVRNRRGYRAAEAGRRFFREEYAKRHREPFCRFLEAVVQGGVAPVVELAERFSWLLSSRGSRADKDFLMAFFADEPQWRGRLEQWIENTLSRERTRR